jgi:D-beta-D-heptose 7-phosphate kinase / D-beta-D-heptose 1-phosphate adenosyltransferase
MILVDPDLVVAAVRGRFDGKRVVVVGDVMVDRYLWGDVQRISPEAPVPVARITRRTAIAGGAANVACNLAALGCTTILVGITGKDAARGELVGLLDAARVEARLLSLPGHQTTVKTRIIGGHQQMIRADEEVIWTSASAGAAELLELVRTSVAEADAVVLSDYAKGMISEEVAQVAIVEARRRHIPVLVDPKGIDWSKYRGATTITPNAGEMAAVVGVSGSDLDGVLNAAKRLQQQLGLDFLTFTRGEHGIVHIEGDTIDQVPTRAKEVFDVSGAGDTVIATLAASLAYGLTRPDSIRLANCAAGIVVGKLGTVPIGSEELLHELVAAISGGGESKLLSVDEAAVRMETWRNRGEVVIFCNGCFDILHAGHVQLLQRARTLGDRLVVGLNSDDSVRRLKGSERPINPQGDRAVVLAGLGCVDAVVIFEQNTPLELICRIRPEVVVKGQDYTIDKVVGAKEVTQWGGRVELLPLLPDRSTSSIVAKMRGRPVTGHG